MATLREMGVTPEAIELRTLRDLGIRGAAPSDRAAQQFTDEAAANNMTQAGLGFQSGRLNTEVNYLRAEQSRLRASGDQAGADQAGLRADHINQRGGRFAPAEQDVTKLGWQPGRVVDYALGAMGQGAASMVDPVAIGVGANVVGGAVGMIPHPAAKAVGGALRLGGMAAGYGVNALQGKGEFYGDALKNPEIMRTKSAQEINNAGNFSGAVSGSLDSLLTIPIAGRLAGRPLTKMVGSLGFAPRVGLDLAGEAVTETAQGEVKRGTLGHLDPTRDTSDDTDARWNDAIGGALGAAPFGAASQLAANGRRRLDVVDDPSNDVSGKGSPAGGPTAPSTPPKDETLAQSFARGAAARRMPTPAEEAWRGALSGEADGLDMDAQIDTQHAALIKELGARVAKGDAAAQQHLATLSAADMADPVGRYDSAARDAARDHLIGDGTSPGSDDRLIAAYAGRKLNEQVSHGDLGGRKVTGGGDHVGGGKMGPPVTDVTRAERAEHAQRLKLTTSILSDSVDGNRPKAAQLRGVAAELASELAELGAKGLAKPTRGDVARVGRLGRQVVALYGSRRAESVLDAAAKAAGIEGSALYKGLRGHVILAADQGAYQKTETIERAAAADQLLAVVPARTQNILRSAGMDLTTPQGKAELLDRVEGYFDSGHDTAPGGPVSTKFNQMFGKAGVEAMREVMGQRIQGRVQQDFDEAENEALSTAEDGDDDTSPTESDDKVAAAEEGAAWERKGAEMNQDRAPGARQRLFKNRTYSTDANSGVTARNPFVRLGGASLPALSTYDATNLDGENTLGDLEARAYKLLGASKTPDAKTQRRSAVRDKAKLQHVRHTAGKDAGFVKGGDMLERGDHGAAADKNVRHQIRIVSAKSEMDYAGLATDKRIDTLADYLDDQRITVHKQGAMDDSSRRRAPSTGPIYAIKALDEKIEALTATTPKIKLTAGKLTGNPEYAALQKLKDERHALTTSLAEDADIKTSRETGTNLETGEVYRAREAYVPTRETTAAELADAYFADRHLVVADEAEGKDHLRIVLGEFREMVEKGQKLLAISAKAGGKKDSPERAAAEFGMNLIRFHTDYVQARKEVGEDGKTTMVKGDVAVPAHLIVAWVNKNKIEYDQVEAREGQDKAEVQALNFRNALLSGIAAMLADGFMVGAPYMKNEKGNNQSFAQGVPAGLHLGALTQMEMTKRARAAEAAAADASARQAKRRAKLSADERAQEDAHAAERHDEVVADEQTKKDDEPARNTDADELVDEGKQAKPVHQVLSDEGEDLVGPRDPLAVTTIEDKAQFWDAPAAEPYDATRQRVAANGGEFVGPTEKVGAEFQGPRPRRDMKDAASTRLNSYPVAPETVDTRLDKIRAPLDVESDPATGIVRPQKGGVPTDFTESRNRNSTRNAALDKIITLTTANAMSKGTMMASEIWGQLTLDRQAGFARVQALVRGIATQPQYAVPLAQLLTPDRVAGLVHTAKPELQAKLRGVLEAMQSKIAAALLQSGQSQAAMTQLARLLTGDAELTSFAVVDQMKKLAGPARLARKKAADEAARGAAETAAKIARKKAGPTETITAKSEPAAAPAPKVKLSGTSFYLAKDQTKADKANKFIGRGSATSSTAGYAKNFGALANGGQYEAGDSVFVSAEGQRGNRVNPDRAELDRAVAAGVTFITDAPADRARLYNLGERQIAKYLSESGYTETAPGEWTGPVSAPAPKAAEPAVRKLNQMNPAAMGSLVADTQAVMRQMGFKGAPERFAQVAAKLLTDPNVNLAQFVKESAEALSHILMKGDGGTAIRAALQSDAWFAERARIVVRLVKTGMMRGDAMVESYRVITQQALVGELAARTKGEQAVLARMMQAVREFVSAFKRMTGSTEFADLVRGHLNKVIEDSVKPVVLKANFKKVSFQEAVDADKQSARVLAHMSLNPKVAITGSIVLAHNGTVYRDAANMLHDLDFMVEGTKADAEAYLRQAFPDAVQIYDFNTSNGKVDSYLVPPTGAKIVDIERTVGSSGKGQGKVTAFKIERDGKVIGRTWNDKNGEHKEGDAGTFVDFFTGVGHPAASVIPFTVGGKQHSIKASAPADIFNAKLAMGREKDLNDFARYTPNVGRKLNQQAADIRPTFSTDAQVAEAKAYVAKVLGPAVKVETGKLMGAMGEWIEADNLIKLSLSAGPGLLSIAHHEALHGLFSRLVKNSPDAALALTGAMSSPRILARLNDLLAAHPAALAAIQGDTDLAREERVAYAYQFWAAGELDIDKPATTLFGKLRRLLRKVFGMVRESETALDILTAFHDGKLAEPSAAGKVIADIMARQTWNEDVKRRFDKQIQHIHAAVAVSNDVLLKSESATVRQLATEFFTNPGRANDGEAREGYLNARTRVVRQYTNYLYKIVKGLNEKQMEQAVVHMQEKTALADIVSPTLRETVKGLRALTKRYYNYATEGQDIGGPGLKLEFLGEDHYPRVWDLAQLVSKRAEFIAMVMQPKYAKVMASATAIANANVTVQRTTEDVAALMHEHLVEKNGVDDKGVESNQDVILSPFFASQKERSFKWLDDADVQPFLDKDLVGTMSRYLHQGIRAAEYARRFGNGGSRLRELTQMMGDDMPSGGKVNEHGQIAKELYRAAKAAGVGESDAWVARRMDDIRKSVQAHEGSLGSDISPTWRKFSSAAMAYQNLRLLPMSLFAAFADPLSIAARGPGLAAAYDAFTSGLKDVWARWKDAASDMPAERVRSEWDEMAEAVGAVDSHMFLEQIGKAHTSEFMTDFARKSNRWLFMANGLTAWDRSMRVTATKYAALFLQNHKSLPDSKHSARWLKELGLTPADITLDADGKLVYDRHTIAATKGIDLKQATAEADKIHYAITRWVEGAVLTPTAAQRPTWASDPRWAVLFHLKQFTYSFQDTVLKRAANEAAEGNMNPIGALAAAVPTMIVADIFKGFVQGGGSLPAYMQGWSLGDHVLHGVSRAGLGGTAELGIDGLRDPFNLLGPTVDQIATMVGNPGDLGANTVNAIPGVRMFKSALDIGRVA